jgi:hypothetical protein
MLVVPTLWHFLAPAQTFPPKNRAKKKDSKRCLTGTTKKIVPVPDTALFRSLNTEKDKAHTNPNQQRRSLFRTQPPCSGA